MKTGKRVKREDRGEAPAAGGKKHGKQGEKRNNGVTDAGRDSEEVDLPGYVLTTADRRIQAVYGYWVHAKDGSNLTGEIGDNSQWQV